MTPGPPDHGSPGHASRRAVKSAFDGSLLRPRLSQGLQQLGIGASDGQQVLLIRFVALLAKWNGVYNLTSIRDPADMLVVHLLDALSIVPLLDQFGPSSILDVGSGAGLPGVPAAVMRPGIEVHTVDAVAKKIGFQLQAKADLQLTNLRPHHARAEGLTLCEPPALIVSRAYADIAKMLASIDHLANDATTVVAMKGAVPSHELASLPPHWRADEIRTLDVPFLGAQRCAVVLKRVGRTH